MKNPLTDVEYLQRTRYREFDIRGAYFRDQTAIIHSRPFRRLKHKTQVFFAPENDHICTRIEHVMHVATIAKTITRGLNAYGWQLDEEMAFAIGLGHDLGHAPFGHDGESVLNKRLGGSCQFIHEINGFRVVEYLTNKGKGLNLTYGVKDGIISHNGEKFEQRLTPSPYVKNLNKIKKRSHVPSSYEGCIVRFADKVAYLGRDIEDAITAKLLKMKDIPVDLQIGLGNKNGEIINNFVVDLVQTSKENDAICFSDAKYKLFCKLADFNYKNIYLNEEKMTYKPYAIKIINDLFDYLENLFSKLDFNYEEYQHRNLELDRSFGEFISDLKDLYDSNTNKEQIITDFISGMTDIYALKAMKQISFPKSMF